MIDFYQIEDFELGNPSYSGHEVYVDAMYNPNGKKIVYKKNKHGNLEFSRLEMAFSALARLFLSNGSTSEQNLVVNENGEVTGLATEHLCYVIEKKEAPDAVFYTLDLEEKDIVQPEDIPYVFFDKLPQNYFSTLLAQERRGQLSIDYGSLANILAGSYTLEENDLHKGNFGFYLVKKDDKPSAVFFKIDHDLMFIDSIMSFKKTFPYYLLQDDSAFNITAEDLLAFPHLAQSSNYYWPTKRCYAPHLWDIGCKEYRSSDEVQAFNDLARVPEFKKAKWMTFYKHILLPENRIIQSLKGAFDENNPSERAKISLMTHAVIARQAKLKSVLFSIPEFCRFVRDLTAREKEELCAEIDPISLPQTMSFYQRQCQPGPFQRNKIVMGDTPLHIAIKLGDYRYEETLQMLKHCINKENAEGKTPLDVAFEMLEADNEFVDIRKNVCSIMKHLLENSAQKNIHFNNNAPLDIDLQAYQFPSPHLILDRVQTYEQLKERLRDIGEDYSFSLKCKKDLAIRCIRHFIYEKIHNPQELRDTLIDLKHDINSESPGLQYIRQLRSRLWIIRQIRGTYGQTSTQITINELLDKAMDNVENIAENYAFV